MTDTPAHDQVFTRSYVSRESSVLRTLRGTGGHPRHSLELQVQESCGNRGTQPCRDAGVGRAIDRSLGDRRHPGIPFGCPSAALSWRRSATWMRDAGWTACCSIRYGHGGPLTVRSLHPLSCGASGRGYPLSSPSHRRCVSQGSTRTTYRELPAPRLQETRLHNHRVREAQGDR